MKRANVVIPADASLLHAKLNTEPDTQMKEGVEMKYWKS